GLSALIERHLSDPSTGHNFQFGLADLFRQSIYSRLSGYEDTNDAERLAEDPTFRMLASRERRETSVALTSTLHWFETDVLAEERNYQGLTQLNADLIQHPVARSPAWRVVLDIDSSESHRQLREPGPRHAGAVRVQRPLRVRLLSPAVRLQSRGRLPCRQTPPRQRPQCRRMGRGPPAHHWSLPPAPADRGGSSGCRVRHAGALRGAGTPKGPVRNSPTGQ